MIFSVVAVTLAQDAAVGQTAAAGAGAATTAGAAAPAAPQLPAVCTNPAQLVPQQGVGGVQTQPQVIDWGTKVYGAGLNNPRAFPPNTLLLCHALQTIINHPNALIVSTPCTITYSH